MQINTTLYSHLILLGGSFPLLLNMCLCVCVSCSMVWIFKTVNWYMIFLYTYRTHYDNCIHFPTINGQTRVISVSFFSDNYEPPIRPTLASSSSSSLLHWKTLDPILLTVTIHFPILLMTLNTWEAVEITMPYCLLILRFVLYFFWVSWLDYSLY